MLKYEEFNTDKFRDGDLHKRTEHPISTQEWIKISEFTKVGLTKKNSHTKICEYIKFFVKEKEGVKPLHATDKEDIELFGWNKAQWMHAELFYNKTNTKEVIVKLKLNFIGIHKFEKIEDFVNFYKVMDFWYEHNFYPPFRRE